MKESLSVGKKEFLGFVEELDEEEGEVVVCAVEIPPHDENNLSAEISKEGSEFVTKSPSLSSSGSSFECIGEPKMHHQTNSEEVSDCESTNMEALAETTECFVDVNAPSGLPESCDHGKGVDFLKEFGRQERNYLLPRSPPNHGSGHEKTGNSFPLIVCGGSFRG